MPRGACHLASDGDHESVPRRHQDPRSHDLTCPCPGLYSEVRHSRCTEGDTRLVLGHHRQSLPPGLRLRPENVRELQRCKKLRQLPLGGSQEEELGQGLDRIAHKITRKTRPVQNKLQAGHHLLSSLRRRGQDVTDPRWEDPSSGENHRPAQKFKLPQVQIGTACSNLQNPGEAEEQVQRVPDYKKVHEAVPGERP